MRLLSVVRSILLGVALFAASQAYPHGPPPTDLVAFVDHLAKVCRELFPDLRSGIDAGYAEWEGVDKTLWDSLRKHQEYRKFLKEHEDEWLVLRKKSTEEQTREACKSALPQLLKTLSEPAFLRLTRDYIDAN